MADLHKYVTKTGNDGNDGSSWADGDAWLTVQHAADNTNPSGYDMVYIHVAAGTYGEQTDVDTYGGSDESHRIIYDGDVENDSGDGASRPIVDGGNSRANGIIGTSSKNYITVQDFEAKNTTDIGIFSSQCTYWIVERCLSHDNTMDGIFFYANPQIDVNSVAQNNICYDNRFGLRSIRANYCKFYNNVSFHNTKSTLSCGLFISLSTNNIAKNNILHDNGDMQIRINNDEAKVGFVSDYNDLYRDTGTYVGMWGTTGTYTTLGDWQTASSQDANSEDTDPKYVNEGAKDFHITDNTSPCYQAGTDLSGTFTDDYDKDTRIHWDIGIDYIVPEVVGLAKMVQVI